MLGYVTDFVRSQSPNGHNIDMTGQSSEVCPTPMMRCRSLDDALCRLWVASSPTNSCFCRWCPRLVCLLSTVCCVAMQSFGPCCSLLLKSHVASPFVFPSFIFMSMFWVCGPSLEPPHCLLHLCLSVLFHKATSAEL